MFLATNVQHTSRRHEVVLICVQEILVDELVAGADAVGREAASNVFGLLLGTPPALATFGTLQALGPLRFFLAPFPTFFEILIRSVG